MIAKQNRPPKHGAYVDGVQTASLGWTGTPGPCTTPVALFFGPYPFSGANLSLAGQLDELTLWNRALNTAEVNAIMNFKQTGTEPALFGFWPFDNAAGPRQPTRQATVTTVRWRTARVGTF